MRVLVLAWTLAGCGRVSFDPLGSCGPDQLAGAPYANSAEGVDGASDETAFLICTPDQLAAIGQHSEHWGSTFRVIADLDLAERTGPFPMIGTKTAPFAGRFDGNGHMIANFTLDQPATKYVGMFAYASGAQLVNVSLTSVDVRGGSFVGALVGEGMAVTLSMIRVDGTVRGVDTVGGVLGGAECYQAMGCTGLALSSLTAAVDVSADGGYVGGIIGYTYSEPPFPHMVSLVTSGSIAGDNLIGGIIGDAEGVYLDQSSSSATIRANAGAGGLVGVTTYASTTIARSSASGDVICTGGNCGGVVGAHEGRIIASHASGHVTCGDSDCGGLAGVVGSPVTTSYATGDVDGVDSVGGLLGECYGEEVSDSYATGTVTGRNDVGGLVGHYASFAPTATTRTYSSSSVRGTDRVGGLFGHIGFQTSIANVDDSFAAGPVAGASATNEVSASVGALLNTAMVTITQGVYSVTPTCANTLGSCRVLGATASDATAFYSTSTPPLTSWDFTIVWQERSDGYPTLR